MIRIFTTGKIGHQTVVTGMNNIEQYFRHIEDICGTEGRYFTISDESDPSLIAVVSYTGVPEEGCLTAFSFGLSSASHEAWRLSRPELVISVNSTDQAWAIAMGELIRNGRNRCLFSYGMILNFGQKVADDSSMSSFLVFACMVLDDADLIVELADRKIHLSQLYPIYESEAALIKQIGPEEFVFGLGIDFFDVKRTPIYQGK